MTLRLLSATLCVPQAYRPYHWAPNVPGRLLEAARAVQMGEQPITADVRLLVEEGRQDMEMDRRMTAYLITHQQRGHLYNTYVWHVLASADGSYITCLW